MRNKERIIHIALRIATLLVLAVIIMMIYFFRTESKEEPVKVGAVLLGSADDKGWNESHYKGIKYACEEHECILIHKESIPEKEAPVKRAVRDLVEQGCSVIFLTSYGYSGYTKDIVDEYPDVAFYYLAGKSNRRNGTAYFARMYQARYLAGIVAGASTESGILGYVASMPISETVRSINAYAMGARKSNPNAKVYVVYTESWEDKDREIAAVEKLAAAGADVMTYHEDKPYALEKAEEMGLYSIGYDVIYDEYSEKMLTAALFNWDLVYDDILNDHLSGRASSNNDYWLGLSDGAVSLYPYSNLVSDKTRKLVEQEEERIQTWRDVFSGIIYDNKGNIRCNRMERIGDEELFNEMDWYVEGIEIYDE
ncbi:MAG: BMP family ABC transporter substrate-binding protein [Lachnospiraceae bacterium]|nr:BMP family ABC transporter substrate-binding protein [Lachnospiraceae bacterium]